MVEGEEGESEGISTKKFRMIARKRGAMIGLREKVKTARLD